MQNIQGLVHGFVSQSLSMDPLERLRRWKHSLDGVLSFRKAVLLTLISIGFLLYVGPGFLSWLFGHGSGSSIVRAVAAPSPEACRLGLGSSLLADVGRFNGHLQSPDGGFLVWTGNGHVGVALDGDCAGARIAVRDKWTLNTTVDFRPIVRLTPLSAQLQANKYSAAAVHYTTGTVHRHECLYTQNNEYVSVAHQIYAHRTRPHVLVQELKVVNPTAREEVFAVARAGAAAAGWKAAANKDIRQFFKSAAGGEAKDAAVTSGLVPSSDGREFRFVSVATSQLPSTIAVGARLTKVLLAATAVAYGPTASSREEAEAAKLNVEADALTALKGALALTPASLRTSHVDAWQSLWTTGFSISHSLADAAVNGAQINATMYYVLSQSAAAAAAAGGDAASAGAEAAAAQQRAMVGYAEGCYGGLPTIHAPNLWKALRSAADVNAAVRLWMLTLEKNGCHQLVAAGAEGVSQAMVLSMVALKFHKDHLELNSHPKDLHRDFHVRRISYGNATHLNVSVVVQADNKAALFVALDRRNKDYFACDAGCLDPPVKLSTEPCQFPVKVTEPLTAILYITSDHQHMEELKHAIHVKEVVDAPAHEHHVIALHRHGSRFGGLPAVFWLSIGFLIFVFHVFLFKLIWQEYCASGDASAAVHAQQLGKFRTSKYYA